MTYVTVQVHQGYRNLLRKSVGENYVYLKPARFRGKPTTQFDGKGNFLGPVKTRLVTHRTARRSLVRPIRHLHQTWARGSRGSVIATSRHVFPTPTWVHWICGRNLGVVGESLGFFCLDRQESSATYTSAWETEQRQSGRKLDATTHL